MDLPTSHQYEFGINRILVICFRYMKWNRLSLAMTSALRFNVSPSILIPNAHLYEQGASYEPCI